MFGIYIVIYTMTTIEATAALFFGSLLAGFLGSLSGLGGGMIIVPLLVLGLHVDIHYAIGASLIAVIATSTGASVAYVKEGYTNIRTGLFLETATTTGAICGVLVGSQLPVSAIFMLFGFVLLYCSVTMFYSNHQLQMDRPPDRLATFLQLNNKYPSKGGMISYHVQHVPLGYLIMFMAGALSGILGIGSGALKVLGMDRVMKLPFKVSTTTSNFMIGVTAAASAGLYLNLGYVDPGTTMPIVLGVSSGAFFGARLLPYTKTTLLRYLFACLVISIALQMLYKGFYGIG